MMWFAHRRMLKAERTDDGVSLIEMLVTMLVGTLLLGMVGSMTIQAQRVGRVQDVRAQNTATAGLASSSVTKYIKSSLPTCDRAASATCTVLSKGIVTGADNKSVTVYTDADNVYATASSTSGTNAGPLKVRFSVPAGGGDLTEQIWKPQTFVVSGRTYCCEYLALPTRTRVIARNVTERPPTAAVPAGAPFSYYTSIPADPSVAATPVGLPLSAATSGNVTHVRMEITVTGVTTPTTTGTTVTSFIVLPNVFRS